MAGADVRDVATSRGKDHCLGYAGGGGGGVPMALRQKRTEPLNTTHIAHDSLLTARQKDISNRI
jgi:hypothetical protein